MRDDLIERLRSEADISATRELDLDGNVRITAIHNYADLQDQIWDFLEQVLESDR